MMMTAAQYEESLRRLNLVVYMFGERIVNVVDDPIIRPSMNAVAKTYEMAHCPEHEDFMTATSHLSGEKINRFTHIHQSAEDLVKKARMGRLLGAHTGCCFQRCVGVDALNALSIVTYNMDEKLGTAYYDRFLNYIVVRGAKAHQTGALNSHEIIVMPTIAMSEADKDYAISFALPSDTRGITYIMGRQSCDTRKLEDSIQDRGNLYFGGHEALCVFDNVFVPWDRVFMYKEFVYCGQLVEKFASYHRQSYACKSGVGDVLIGAAQTAAEYNGVQKAAHIRDKLIEMNHLSMRAIQWLAVMLEISKVYFFRCSGFRLFSTLRIFSATALTIPCMETSVEPPI